MGTHLSTIRERALSHQGLVSQNGEERMDQEVQISSWLSNVIRSETQRETTDGTGLS
jgi:hypothetical protein